MDYDWTIQHREDLPVDHDINRRLVSSVRLYCHLPSKPRDKTFKDILTLADEN